MKVCACCFNDIELKSFIASNFSEIGKCDYCCDVITSELLEIEEILDFFAEFIGVFKEDADGESFTNLVKADWNLFSEKIGSHNLFVDILKILNTSISNPQQKVNYTDDIIECTSHWKKLKYNLKWERRFLIDIEKLFDLGWGTFFNKESTLPINEVLYRARIHKDGGQKAFLTNEMGCPEKDKTTSGRANPQGIPYLYLSKTIETTLYETRASYLDEISIGKFKIKEKKVVVLVDFTEEVSAYSNIGNIKEYTKSILLKKSISMDLSKPMRRYDSELEYIPTQFICEFIRYNIKTDFKADGILFNSSLHKGGKNIVLFDQNKVECISVEIHHITNVNIQSSILENE